ncbi:cold shock domain-containing protein [Candidatus Pacearchaeota archaeon]|nr:cold shock domain-containing protein [Candidatus Pacearchaeota archaeon]
MKGKVKFFNDEKEFGFIVGEDGKEYFVHKSALQGDITIEKDDEVMFETEKGDRGMKAVKITKANK